ncbi:hypothetical protein NDU88_003596 [Pleurodeles waltl]|uniref:Uncharacterized protein n=1 Tax=Pleurodeles waltl TaxID=8319 RepID=A0AAV7M6R2_PLEWA|nr:hypothetical protein NDU88_003596 [Pleurodeles waltl]
MSRRIRLTPTLGLIEGQARGPAPRSPERARCSTAAPAPPVRPASSFLAWDARPPRRFVWALVFTAQGPGSSCFLVLRRVIGGSYFAARARLIPSHIPGLSPRLAAPPRSPGPSRPKCGVRHFFRRFSHAAQRAPPITARCSCL